MTYSFHTIILYFFIFSLLGWLCETIYCSFGQKKFVKRGFLYGPYCPIYGFGGVFLMLATHSFLSHPVLIFLASFLGASILEYFTSWLLEDLFHVRWWDYSHNRFNLHGRVCLKNSILFGMLGLILSYIINPGIIDAINNIPMEIQKLLANGILVLLFFDFILTINRLSNFTKHLESLQLELATLQHYNKEYGWFDPKDFHASLDRLWEIAKEDLNNPSAQKILNILYDLELRRSQGLLHRFPNMQTFWLNRTLKIKEKGQVWKSKMEQKKEELEQKSTSIFQELWTSFKSNLNYYNLFWIFFICSILGYVVEMIFCVIKNGQIQSRQGLLYGPFTQIYGVGAVLLVLLLEPLIRKKNSLAFLGGAIVGGTFEYFASWAQQAFFHSNSWNYSGQFLNINGRTSVFMMILWGFLGLGFVKFVYPLLEDFIQKIPKKIGVIMTVILTVLLSIDILLSAAAVYRWSERAKGNAPGNRVEEFLDKHYDNDYMEKIYSNLQFHK